MGCILVEAEALLGEAEANAVSQQHVVAPVDAHTVISEYILIKWFL